MSRLTYEQLSAAYHELAEKHCPTRNCGCATCVAARTIVVYRRFLKLLDGGENVAMIGGLGGELWLRRIRGMLEVD